MTELVKANNRTTTGFYVTTVSYVGCFSEPEIYYIDKDGGFTSLLHDQPSGDTGILYGSNEEVLYTKSAKKIHKYVMEEYAPYLAARFAKSCSGIDEIKEIAGYYKCDKCGNNVQGDEITGVDHKSYGGLSYFPTKYICFDCHCANTCQNCGEYCDDIVSNWQVSYCEYCFCRDHLKLSKDIYDFGDLVKYSEIIKLTKKERYFHRWKSYLNINL